MIKTKLIVEGLGAERRLDLRINNFLAENKNIHVIDIKLSTCADGEFVDRTALIIYEVQA